MAKMAYTESNYAKEKKKKETEAKGKDTSKQRNPALDEQTNYRHQRTSSHKSQISEPEGKWEIPTTKAGGKPRGQSDWPDRSKKDTPVADTKKTDNPATTSTDKPKKKTSAFGTAFAEARKAGKTTFEWKGKKYTTKLASEGKKKTKSEPKPDMSKAPSAPKPSTSAGQSAARPREDVARNSKDESPTTASAPSKAGKAERTPFRKESESASEVTEAYENAYKNRKKRNESMA
jgi:hypothetical protein